jgi:ankyrin repeat protein
MSYSNNVKNSNEILLTEINSKGSTKTYNIRKLIESLVLNNNVDYVRDVINYKEENTGSTLLIEASKISNNYIVKMLLDIGADPNLQNNSGNTPLLFACNKGKFNAVKLLLSNGADPNLQNNDGNSPITLAIRDNNIELIKLLLSNGANIPENIDELLENKSAEMKLIFRNWNTTMGLAVTEDLGLDPGNEIDMAEFLATRTPEPSVEPSGGKKRRKRKSNKRKSMKNKRKSRKNKRKSSKNK